MVGTETPRRPSRAERFGRLLQPDPSLTAPLGPPAGSRQLPSSFPATPIRSAGASRKLLSRAPRLSAARHKWRAQRGARVCGLHSAERFHGPLSIRAMGAAALLLSRPTAPRRWARLPALNVRALRRPSFCDRSSWNPPSREPTGPGVAAAHPGHA